MAAGLRKAERSLSIRHALVFGLAERRRMQFVSRLGVARGANSGRTAGRPGPREVVPADRAKGVEHFPTQKQPRVPTALERPRLHFVERDATSRDFGLLVAFVAL
jgi:hypothetical protein